MRGTTRNLSKESLSARLSKVKLQIITKSLTLASPEHIEKVIVKIFNKQSLNRSKENQFSMDGLIHKDAIIHVPGLVEKYKFLCFSFSEPLQKAGEVRFESSESKCGTDIVMYSCVDGHMEGSLVCANTDSIGVNENLITESKNSRNPSAEELGSVGFCERQSTKLIHNITPSLHDHVDQIPIEGMGLYKLTSTLECGEDHIGEMVKMSGRRLRKHHD